MTSFEKCYKFRFIFDVKCLDCLNEKQITFILGDFFNLEGDYINKKNDECKYICSACKLEIFVDLHKIFKPIDIRAIYHGILLL